jgi:ElaB/YqjD/DUF883 family membrane-anchored ribosome-binding protein
MDNQDPGPSGTGQHPMRDWTKPTPGETTDRDRQRSGEQRYGEPTQAAKTYGSEAQEHVQGAVQQTREYVEGTVQQARDKVAEYREGGVERIKQDMVHYTRQEPMIALLIALGAGLLLGLLTAVGRR